MFEKMTNYNYFTSPPKVVNIKKACYIDLPTSYDKFNYTSLARFAIACFEQTIMVNYFLANYAKSKGIYISILPLKYI